MALLFIVLGDMLTCYNTDECEETLLNQFGIPKIPESNIFNLVYMSQQDGGSLIYSSANGNMIHVSENKTKQQGTPTKGCPVFIQSSINRRDWYQSCN